MRTIAIDFDGVIHKYSKGWHDGTAYDEPTEGSFEAISKLLLGYDVFVLTAREIKETKRWLIEKFPDIKVEEIPPMSKFWTKHGVLGITNRKLPAAAYIDDRGIRFTNWTDVLNYF